MVIRGASQDGLGAALYQQQAGIMSGVIAYASSTLTPAEKYHLYAEQLEFLALKWALCEQFRDYLYYAPEFTVFSDNNSSLTYVLTSAKLNATGLRWVGEFSEFNFNIKYRPGTSNIDVDNLSRLPRYFEQYMASCTDSASQADLSITSILAQDEGDVTWLSSFTVHKEMLSQDEIFLTQNVSCSQIRVVNIAKIQQVSAEVRRFLFELPKLRIDLRYCRTGRKSLSHNNVVNVR